MIKKAKPLYNELKKLEEFMEWNSSNTELLELIMGFIAFYETNRPIDNLYIIIAVANSEILNFNRAKMRENRDIS